jgi:mRNA-degrading endonuclease YafQ of YafQ-DinJ toxin-antitoxin module
LVIRDFRYTDRFKQDFKALDLVQQEATGAALERLLANPRANSLRLHTLRGFGKPTIYKIDVDPNHAYQVSFTLDGQCAHLLRVGTHRELDRDPR